MFPLFNAINFTLLFENGGNEVIVREVCTKTRLKPIKVNTKSYSSISSIKRIDSSVSQGLLPPLCISLLLAILLVWSSSPQMSHDFGTSIMLVSLMSPRLLFHSFYQSPIRDSQAFSCLIFSCLSCSLKLQRKHLKLPHPCNVHASKFNSMWMMLTSLATRLNRQSDI